MIFKKPKGTKILKNVIVNPQTNEDGQDWSILNSISEIVLFSGCFCYRTVEQNNLSRTCHASRAVVPDDLQ